MPRPKPPEELKPRAVRMSDVEYAKFKEWGGANRLRMMLDAQPEGYYKVFLKATGPDAAFINRKYKERND
jgi:hypothetical protein